MDEFFGLAAIIALGMKLVSFLKFVRAKQWDDAFTQLAVWASGIAVVFLAAEADVTSGLKVGNFVLGAINTASKVYLGLALLSLGSVVYDFKKARDNNDSAREPNLLSGK